MEAMYNYFFGFSNKLINFPEKVIKNKKVTGKSRGLTFIDMPVDLGTYVCTL